MPADTLEFLGWIIDGLGGWRYLFSQSFRKRTHERWRIEGRAKAFADVLFGALTMVFTLFLLGVLIALMLGTI